MVFCTDMESTTNYCKDTLTWVTYCIGKKKKILSSGSVTPALSTTTSKSVAEMGVGTFHIMEKPCHVSQDLLHSAVACHCYARHKTSHKQQGLPLLALVYSGPDLWLAECEQAVAAQGSCPWCWNPGLPFHRTVNSASNDALWLLEEFEPLCLAAFYTCAT